MIALITPTGAREQQIKLCAQFMARQDYTGPVVWVIVDDALPHTTDFITTSFRAGWQIVNVYPQPPWQAGQNTQGRNIAAGIDALLANYARKTIEAIYIIEDDDYYRPCYLSAMRQRIEGYQLAGETHTIYYNLRLRRWIENQNAAWSSLFQTVFTLQALPTFTKLYQEKFIDYSFFQLIEQKKNLFRAGNLAIGIKGQAGRAGIGAGHGFIAHMLADPDGEKLRELIGNDANLYL